MLKHNNLMLRSERRERLEAWVASDSPILHRRYWPVAAGKRDRNDARGHALSKLMPADESNRHRVRRFEPEKGTALQCTVAWPCNGKSSHRPHQLPCFTQQIPNLPAFGNRVAGKKAVPARIAVSFLSARASPAAVHAAARLAAHRRRAARPARACFGAATWAHQQLTRFWRGVAHASALRSWFVAVRQSRMIIRCGRGGSTSMSGFWRLIAAERHHCRL